MSIKSKAILMIILFSVIGGATAPITKIGLLKIPPFTFSFLRFFIASLFILPLFLKEKIKFNKSLVDITLLSMLPIINISFFVFGIRTTTASISQMLYAGTPILVGLFGFILLKNKLPIKKWLFVFLGLVGVFMIIILPLFEKQSLFAGDLRGNLLVTVGVFFWSLYMVLSKQYQKKYSPITITSLFIFLSTVVFFFLSFLEINSLGTVINSLKTPAILSILYVSILATFGSYLINQYAIKYGGTIIASFSFYLVPIFTYFSSFILLGEKLTAGLIIGTVITFISVALYTYWK